MAIKGLAEEEFEITVAEQGDVVELHWKGSMHAANPEELLDPYFDSLLAELESGNKRLVCNFVGLEYMNSASIPPLIQLLRRLAESEIQGEFVYDSSRKVQTASFRALDVIARKSEYTSVKGV